MEVTLSASSGSRLCRKASTSGQVSLTGGIVCVGRMDGEQEIPMQAAVAAWRLE